MEERVAIVTGGLAVSGEPLSLELASAGYRVVAVYRTDGAAAETLAEEASALGPRPILLRHNVASGELPVATIPGAKELVLVNNAGAHFQPKPFHKIDGTELARLHAVAVGGAFFTVQALLRRLVAATPGTVVNVLSAAIGPQPPRGFAAYVAAKEGLRGLTRALAAEYSERGLRVLGVSPGFLETDLTGSWSPHLRAAILGTGDHLVPVVCVARRIRELIEDATLAAAGEEIRLDDIASVTATGERS